MPLSPIALDGALERLEKTSIDPTSFEGVSEFVRSEVHARRHVPRATALSSVARWLAPAVPIEEARLSEVCAALEREGDLISTPGGILYATPTRVVVVKNAGRVFSSVPTKDLIFAVGRQILVKQSTRTIHSLEGLADAVANIDGAMVTPEVWAGLERTAPADATFIANLEQRLEWQAMSPGSLGRDGVLEWRSWDVTSSGPRWTRRDEGRLWWARTRFGGHHRVWTAGGPPSSNPFVELSADDADRARFAITREVPGAPIMRVVRAGQRVTFHVPAWLPRPEYRWLSLHAEPRRDLTGSGWEVSAEEESEVASMLAKRLGLVMDHR